MSSIRNILDSPKLTITYTWGALLFLLIISFIIACIASAFMKESRDQKVIAFASTWSIILAITVSVLGPIILRKERNSFWIGIFIGVVFIMSNQMLIVFGFLVSRIRYDSDSGKIADVEKALAVFSFFLAFVLAVFCLLLLKHHKDIVSAQEESVLSNSNASEAKAVAGSRYSDSDTPLQGGDMDMPPESI